MRSFFKRKKTLAESNPSELSLEMLHHLQAALIAKLLVTNREMHKRYSVFADGARTLPDGARLLPTFQSGLDRLERLTAVLELELERISGSQVDLSGSTTEDGS